ncbi:G-type lectin S-receptor-like serine/threonine-protein kinase At1g11300 [Salvia hispanica]|uniref:G-type lectin S-receptor-like serine/threonine-protein kinase At1g11300 n=1 Tax=Salvia hispanica TaxID=49212 RepID=UPI002009DB8B|nr:G-type lectin S-receptor-like serine/threonine-protein kinase At1g11300 [Salvia hispanica]
MSAGVIIRDPQTMASAKKEYKLGFFSPPNTTNRYLGIFYALSEETVIWVANRDTPLTDSSGAVTLSQDGNLVVLDGTNRTVWSTNLTTSSVISPVVQNPGHCNLVLREEVSGDTLWESFSHPTDVMVQGMTLSQNVKTGKQVLLTAWKNATDPGMGSFTGGIDAMSGTVQLFTWNEVQPHWRSGPWNGQIFLGIKEKFYAYLDAIAQVNSDSAGNIFSPLRRLMGSSCGILQEARYERLGITWRRDGTWWPIRKTSVMFMASVGCLRGFEPVNEDEWGRGNWTNGCRRKRQLQCGDDRFERLRYMKVPDFAKPSSSRVQDECRTACQRNCSCIAYAYDSYIGCMFWSNILIDTQEFDRVGVDLYVRLSASEFDRHKERKLYIIIGVAVGFVCISILMFIAWWLIEKRKGSKAQDSSILEAGQMFTTDSTAIVLKDGDLPKFTLKMLANATNQFHEDNLLGRGGFGPVYMGVMANEKEIAVKRLSAESGQGMQEFMNEKGEREKKKKEKRDK